MTNKNNRGGWFAALAVLLFSFVAPAAAQNAELPKPEGNVILTIDGNIGATNGEGVADFDIAMLEKLKSAKIKTSTPWFDNEVEFEGALMTELMKLVQADGKEVVVTALNDYQAPVPIADFAAHGTILAYKRDGEYMPVSDKGPLFIIYPYDSSPELNTQKYYSRSVWQIRRFTVR
ncbi:molybdopterin-dependent oxidoreductase [Nitratireductor aquimarinus]|uniref:Molybdopterin-dependent oxidoreductase n=1 Tax=Nitratireductor aquimarinus TaxID=889300 RepID=A0ABU4AQ81_9HYPH|nr:MULTISPECIES: molybdopterin-dependent oxidoreductase [Nitratireductor]MDV6228401.1 molybdopterin-dependent oxidoreductase [Nitratireductor aquimarinus]